jgi:uncharacterized Zn finger protein (UPF0148 family)
MAEQRCPNCGTPLPEEQGQHALTPTSRLVTCPTCGEPVHIERPETAAATPVGDEGAREHREQFSGEETVAGVMEEIERKEES